MNKLKLMLLISLTSFSINSVYAAVCLEDMNQMNQQIAKYGSISTPDGKNRFDNITDAKPEKASVCSAKAYRGMSFVCMINWSKHNWGSTFHCV